MRNPGENRMATTERRGPDPANVIERTRWDVNLNRVVVERVDGEERSTWAGELTPGDGGSLRLGATRGLDGAFTVAELRRGEHLEYDGPVRVVVPRRVDDGGSAVPAGAVVDLAEAERLGVLAGVL